MMTRSRLLHRFVALTIVIAIAAGDACVATAQDEDPASAKRERAVKAALLYRFAAYTKWTAVKKTASKRFVIAFYGPSKIEPYLRRIAQKKKKIGKRPIEIIRFDSMAKWRPCHVLYIEKLDQALIDAARKRAEAEQVLLVGHQKGFERKGLAINFYREGKNVRFALNTVAIERTKLKISVRLMRHARLVHVLEIRKN